MTYRCLGLQQVSHSTTHFLPHQAASATLAVRNQSMQQLVSWVYRDMQADRFEDQLIARS